MILISVLEATQTRHAAHDPARYGQWPQTPGNKNVSNDRSIPRRVPYCLRSWLHLCPSPCWEGRTLEDGKRPVVSGLVSGCPINLFQSVKDCPPAGHGLEVVDAAHVRPPS